MEERFRRFKAGRYGPDILSQDLVRGSLGMLLLGIVIRQSIITWLAVVVTGYAWYRILSKDVAKRAAERQKYLPFRAKITAPFRKWIARAKTRKTHRIFHCDQCGETMKVPKGKGTIRITCPQCGHTFTKKT